MNMKAAVATALAAVGLVAGMAGMAGPAWAASATASRTVPRWPRASAARPRYFNDVSCASTTFCAGVGNSFSAPGLNARRATLAEIWNGTKWTVTPAAYTRSPSYEQWLQGVSCASASFCVAAGNYAAAGSRIDHAFIDTWNGAAWAAEALPEPPGTITTSAVRDVACTSRNSCIAVGSSDTMGEYGWNPQASTAWQWDGTKWSILKMTNLGQQDINTTFTQLSCSSATACTAIGQFPLGDDAQTYVAVLYNGVTWTVRPLPAAMRGPRAVACPSQTSCFAVGAGPRGAAVAHWNGTTWATQPVPQPRGAAPGTAGLTDVSCTAPGNCTAAGLFATASGHELTLYEHWNGTTWSSQASPRYAGQLLVSAVSCVTANACTSAGTRSATGEIRTDTTLAEHWNGTRWTAQPTP